MQSLAGRYYTACDMGTYPDDMDIIATESRFVTGRTRAKGGAGDSSTLTAYGVFHAMRAAAEHRWGTPSLRGRRVGVAGVGKVGRKLVAHLLSNGASVVIADVEAVTVGRVRDRHPEVDEVDADKLITLPLDVYAPCALGGILDEQTVPALQAEVVCGGANNQLAHDGIDALLLDRDILYAPDYVVNAGGLIQVADEITGYNEHRAQARATKIFDTTKQILTTAAESGTSPTQAADRVAQRRIAGAGRRRELWLPNNAERGPSHVSA